MDTPLGTSQRGMLFDKVSLHIDTPSFAELCNMFRGHLYISWERGAETFDRYLIDWDPAINSANWMWLCKQQLFENETSRLLTRVVWR